MVKYAAFLTVSVFLLVAVPAANAQDAGTWTTVEAEGEPVPRHEAAFVEFDGKFYLIGGRGRRPVSVYDPETNVWSNHARPPYQVHHFQPVVYGDAVYLMGAMTGGFPNETGLEKVLVYYPREDRFEELHEVPEERRRGGAGAVLHEGKIYLVGGIVRGHMGGFVPWFDEYDPETGEWRQLPDAPTARDHFQATMVGSKIYAAGGRQTSRETGELFSRTIPEVDVFDFATGEWTQLDEDLPTPRAGSMSITVGDEVIVVGGESTAQRTAHAEVEGYSERRGHWRSLPSLNRGRHGSGVILHKGFICTCSGSGNRGGAPELKSMEKLYVGENGESLAE
ncbi:MAG: Kelch repeat-containing protein [Opitutales bacterium]